MLSIMGVLPRGHDPGVCSPANGGYAADTLGDPFGERTFAAHASGVDFHRGYDTLDGEDGPGEPVDSGGMPIYSPVNGSVIRRYYGHFSWFDAANMSKCTEVDPNSKATFAASAGTLTITGKNTGTVAFPSGIAQLQKTEKFMNVASDNDWLMMFILQNTVTLTGKLVIGIYNSTDAQWGALEYDGSTFTVKGTDAGGVMTANGTTAAPAARKYGRVRYVSSTGTMYWDHSSDGSTWTQIASEVVTWTNGAINFKAFIGFDPAAAGGDDSIPVKYWGTGDSGTINRFGNWIEISSGAAKWAMMHFRDFDVNVGDIVRAGQQIGITGRTGFDYGSGLITENHLHTEYMANSGHDYANEDPVNPYAATLLPRADTAVDISVVRDEANDPYTAAPSHRLTITVTRGTWNNFQINEFQMIGNLATRTLNWNTRSGLDPLDVDANQYDGLFFEPVAFNSVSATYVFKLYASKAVVGATWSSGYVKDADGNTIWSG